MEKYINSLIRGFKKIFNKKYFAVVSIFVGIVAVLGVSYGYLSSESGWELAAQLRISKLYYSISADGVATNEIVVAANSGTTYHNVEITSLNEINTRYALTYRVTGGATVDVSSASTNAGSGVIGIYSTGANTEKKKTIRIAVTNNSSSSSVVTLDVSGGYTWNPENQISVKTGFALLSTIHNEAQVGLGLTLAEQINALLSCTPTASVPCYYTNNSNNYLTYSGNTWRIIGTYLVDGNSVVKLILDEPLTNKVTYSNVSSALTTFYNGLSDTSLIQGSATSITKAEYDAIGGVNSYLYTKPDKEYWTATQYYVGTSRGSSNLTSSATAYVRPVITLKPTVVNSAAVESGTSTNPYAVAQGVKLNVTNLTYGTTNVSTGYYAAGKTYTVNNPVSTNSNISFHSWSASGTGTSISGTTLTMGSVESTLTAIWAAKLTYIPGTSNPREVAIGNEEFIVLNDIINYSSLDSTFLTKINYNSNKTILLAKHNLYVGLNCNDSNYSSCTPISTSASGYGLQSADAKGWLDNSLPALAVVPFAGSSVSDGYWHDTTNGTIYSKYGTYTSFGNNLYDADRVTAPNWNAAFYSDAGNANYSIAYYVEGYIDRLGVNGTGRLITYTELLTMFNDTVGRTHLSNGASFWGCSANNSVRVISYSSTESGLTYPFNRQVFNGVRPIIVVDTADIKMPFVTAGTDATTGLPVVRSVSNPSEEFYDISNAINYSSLISTNGNIYGYDSNKSILLAKYNLYVGRNYDGSAYTEISSSSNGYGLQSSSAIGYTGATQRVAVVPFAGSSGVNGYWYDSSNNAMYSKYGASYNGSNIYDADYATVPNYSVAFSGNAGNANYSVAYYVEEYTNRIGLPGMGRLLTYTEANAMTQEKITNGGSYWLGSAGGSDGSVWRVSYAGSLGHAYAFYSDRASGVRPVIVVSTSGIESGS